jgi:hypothetical protein
MKSEFSMHKYKKELILTVSFAYLLISLCVVFLLPKFNPDGYFLPNTLKTYCKAKRPLLTAINFLKRTEKISISIRKQGDVRPNWCLVTANFLRKFIHKTLTKSFFYSESSFLKFKLSTYLVNCCWIL